MFSIIILCVICFTLWRVNKKGEKSTKYLSPPVLKGSLPLIGHSYVLLGNSTYLWKLMKIISVESLKCGGIVSSSIGLGPQARYYIVSDPEDALTIANACTNKHYTYNLAKRWLGSGLITASGSTWKKHRKLLSPAFSNQVLLGFLDIFNAQSRKLQSKLDEAAGAGPFDISLPLRQTMLENICQTALGISTEEDAELLKSYAHAVEVILNVITLRFQTIWLQSDFLYSFTDLKKREDEVLKTISGMAEMIIKRKKAAILENKVQPISTVSGLKCKALLELLLELSDEDELTDQEIKEEIDTAITAGLDTSAWVLTYTLVLLGSYPEIQEKVFREVKEVFGDEDRDVDKNDFPKLVYTEAVIKESLRLYSVVPITLRTLERDLKLKNYTLKKGESCIISSYGIHRHSCWGPDRLQFRPERWLEPSTQRFVFAGFSLGRRTCLGRTYAMMTLKTVLSHLLLRYKVTANVKDLQLKMDFILKPIAGHFVSIERRI